MRSENSLVANGACDAVPWSVGERLNHLFEQRCDLLQESGRSHHPPVVGPGITLTNRGLDEQTKRLARYLLRWGVQPGDRVGLLLDRSFHAYVVMRAILKIDAAYVPLDASFPGQEIGFIAADADVRFVITLSALESGLEGIDVVRIAAIVRNW